MSKHTSARHRYRTDLLQIYRAALSRVAGDTAVADWLRKQQSFAAPLAVVAIGKAAPAMMAGASKVLGQRLVSGLVITREGYAEPGLENHPAMVQIESAHPIPDTRSLEAGRQLLEFIARQPGNRQLLFLISGGSSSLVEVLPEPCTLEQLQSLNHWLLASGLAIGSINRIRSRISRIKGGQLCRFLEGRQAQVLLISDVPGDDPAIVGSGLLYPLPGCGSLPQMPPGLSACLAEARPVCNREIPHATIATNSDAQEAAAQAARMLGYKTTTDLPFLQGDAAARGREFGQTMLGAAPGVYILGGETTVTLPPQPGRGGRNQHLALAAAAEIRGREDILILAAGTDGTDGMSDDAGALVDGGTWMRAVNEGFDPQHSLNRADSGTLLEATGDLVYTGPTGTNVMDLLIGLRLASSGSGS
ncbi:glycerate kinase type-2 family protein [Thiolapillus brandeum]|nr:DUF4147 domain-containing protein [Thiolapillus brandeum]